MRRAANPIDSPLKKWMDANGYTNRTLAERLGLSYDYIYKMATSGDKPVSDRFKFRFIEHFGIEEANKAFELSPNFLATEAI